MKSLERVLLAWIFGALLLGSALVTMTIYVVTLVEMNEVFDSDLRNVATGVAGYHQLHGPHGRGDGRGEGQGEGRAPILAPRHDDPEDAEIATFAWDKAGQLLYSSDPRVAIGFTSQEGLSQTRINGEEWIVYTAVHDTGVVQAAQRRSSRREVAGEAAAKILPFLFALAVLVSALMVYGLRRGLRPLDAAAQDIAGRSARSLTPIDMGSAPREIQPVVHAINGLMAKLDQSFSSQRQFISEAAHELRTPVAALRLQLHLLEKSATQDDRAAATGALKQGLARAQRLIEQLLAVARADPAGHLSPLQPVDLGEIVRLVVEPWAVQADQWGVDLGADLGGELPGPVTVMGDTEQLLVLLTNLVDNAVRYAPAGGVVDVGVARDQGRPCLWVRDTGPGIPQEDWPRLFSRFYRGRGTSGSERGHLGSGLGLSIVKSIADRHGATVQVVARAEGPGLEVRVVFPEPAVPGGVG